MSDSWNTEQSLRKLAEKLHAEAASLEEAADVLGLLDHAGAERGTVIGHDWGADVAWKTAWLHPERVLAVAGQMTARSAHCAKETCSSAVLASNMS